MAPAPAQTWRRDESQGVTKMVRTVDDYMASVEGVPGEVAHRLRTLLHEIAPEMDEALKWSQAVYSSNGPVCYFRAGKNHVTFGFWRGNTLRKHHERLESGGEKMAHLKLRTLDDIDATEITSLVKSAIELNRKRGDPTKEPRKEKDKD